MPDPFYKESLVTYLAEQGISMDLSLKEFDKKLMAMFEKNFKYDYVAFEGSNDTVYEFLTASKIGNCQNFASAATLIYRAKGIPARYTTGYFVYNKQPGKTTVITPLQAHAWVEIYKAGYGWLPLDYTISNLSNIFGEEEELPEIDDPNDTGILGDSTLDVNCNVPETNYLLDVQAKTPGTYYLREESYGDFNLEEFTPGNKYNVTTNTNPNHFVTEALKTYNKSSRTIDVTYKEKYGSRHQLVPTYFAGDSSVTTDCDLYYDAAQTNETKSLESIDFDYLLNSDEVADYVIHDPVLKEEEYYYYVYANKHYLTVPDDIKAVVEEAILKYSPVIPSSPVLICKVARDYFAESYIRFNPRMELSYKELVNDIEGFFENARPEVNAKSVSIIATMLLRSLGVPTRSVKGFLYIAEDDNKYALNDYNEHYWNEVYIKGLGWVTIDFLKSSGKLDNFTDYFTGKTHITIKADNYESYYNGKYQNAPEPYVKEGESILEQDEHFLDYESRGSTDICEEPLDYTITICDYNFNDKTYRYAIDNEFGTMSIKKAPITIYTKSISDTFEPGKVLKTEIERIECPTFGIDDLKFSFNGNQLTNIGSVEAMIDIDTLEIYNISGVEITEKFDINIVAGVLEFK